MQHNYWSFKFLEERKMITPAGAAATSDTAENTECGGIWKVPRDCNPENYTCEYSAKWELIPRKDTIRFTITTKHTDTWTGIAFSNDEKMVSCIIFFFLTNSCTPLEILYLY